MALPSGTRFGRYEIRSLIGTGGMGEVYLAHDIRLNRPVAIKLLLDEYTKSREHLHRFEREAKATSALNHPNILTIYEVGRARSKHFIATEFVDGQTLRQILKRGPLSLHQALDIAIQVSSGLAAAHRASIVHRDIKPENIMLRADGYVKVLDFGLAKLTEGLINQQAEAEAAESTVTNINTSSGAIIGTVSYMSPEQLRGLTIDARTDIWSLGVVLYEMVAGHTPFEGRTPVDVIVSILDKRYQPLRDRVTGFPQEIERVLNRALAKERTERYQTIQELLEELRKLKHEFERDERWHSPLKPKEESKDQSSVTREQPSIDTSRAATARLTANQNRLTSLIRGHKTNVLIAVLIVAAFVAIPLGIYQWRHSGQRLTTSFQMARLSKLVDVGKAADVAISPDGKFIVYAIEEGWVQSLWTRQVATTSNPVSIIPRAVGRFQGMTFSPDGNYIYFVIFDDSLNQGVLYKIQLLGGTPQKLLEDIETPVTFSPDGKQIAFVRGYPEQRRTALIIANADGTGIRTLATRDSPDDFGWKGGPGWSPDGKTIVCAAGAYDSNMHLVEVSVADGSQKNIMDGWAWIGRAAWLKDESGILVPAKDRSSTITQVWYVSYSEGKAQRVTNDLSDYSIRGISLAADSKSLVAVATDYLSSIWLIPRADTTLAHPLVSYKSDGLKGLSWTPDGRLVYASSASGNQDIWIMNANGSGQKQLTHDGSANYYPSVSPDGRYIAFTSTRSGSQNIWMMDIDGGNLKQLTNSADATWPQWSPDNAWIVYKDYGGGKRTLWKISVNGGAPVQVTERYTDWPSVSPDGKLLACMYWDEQLTTQAELAILPFDGGNPIKTFKFSVATQSFTVPNVLHWTPDGRNITYIDDPIGTSNILSQSLDGGAPKALTQFKSDRIFWFDWSRDGKTLACARGSMNSDVVLISNLQE